MKVILIILIVFLACPGIAYARPLWIDYDRTDAISEFQDKFVKVDALARIQNIDDSATRFIEVASCLIILNEMHRSLSSATSTRYTFVDNRGRLRMHGTKPEDLPNPDERRRYVVELNHHTQNGVWLNRVAQIRAGFLSEMLNLVDGSSGAEKVAFLNLFDQLKVR